MTIRRAMRVGAAPLLVGASEADTVKACKHAAAIDGVLLYENVVEESQYGPWATGLGYSSSDYIGFDTKHDARAFFIEFKKRGGSKKNPKRVALQKRFLENVTQWGAVGAVIESPEEMRAVIKISRLEPHHRRPIHGPEAVMRLALLLSHAMVCATPTDVNAGTYRVRIDGEWLAVERAAGESIESVTARIRAAINEKASRRGVAEGARP